MYNAYIVLGVPTAILQYIGTSMHTPKAHSYGRSHCLSAVTLVLLLIGGELAQLFWIELTNSYDMAVWTVLGYSGYSYSIHTWYGSRHILGGPGTQVILQQRTSTRTLSSTPLPVVE